MNGGLFPSARAYGSFPFSGAFGSGKYFGVVSCGREAREVRRVRDGQGAVWGGGGRTGRGGKAGDARACGGGFPPCNEWSSPVPRPVKIWQREQSESARMDDDTGST